MNSKSPGQATKNPLRNLTKPILDSQLNKSVFSEALPNETKPPHTYLPTYLTKPQLTKREGKGRVHYDREIMGSLSLF